MAVVPRNQTNTDGNTTNKGGKNNQEPLAEVDLAKLLQMKGVGPKRDLDATEDAWEYGAPCLPGRYQLKVYMSKDKPKMGFYDEAKKEPWFTLPLECKLQSDDPEVKNTTVFTGVSTRINARKKISTAAGLIVKYGFKIPSSASDVEVVQLVDAVLKKERIIEAEIDWKAGYKEVDGSWMNLANTYEDFPENPEGGRDHEIKVTKKDGSKEEVRARLYIAHWYGKDEPTVKRGDDVGVGTSVKGNKGTPNTLSSSLVLAEDDNNDDTGVTGLVANTEQPKVVATKIPKSPTKEKESEVSDDDALAILLGGD